MVAVALTDLVANIRSDDILGSGTALTTGQTIEVAALGESRNLLFVFEETGTAAASIVWDAGDEPPSMRAGLGSLTVVFASLDVRSFILEGGRFIQDDGEITGTLTGAGKLTVFSIPKTW